MNKYMKVAKDLADFNLETNNGGPFGACVVRDDKIIGKGSNCVLCDNDPTAHAEIMAIRDACRNIGTYDLSGCVLYTSCFPCPMCLSAIIWSNIKKVYYGNTAYDAKSIGFRDEFIYDFINNLSNGKDSSVLDFKCIDREETIKSFEDYMNKTDKIIY